MMLSNSKHTTRKIFSLSLGPLQWRCATVREAQDHEADQAFTTEIFIEHLQALIDLALREGCPLQEVKAILSRHTDGDHHGDA